MQGAVFYVHVFQRALLCPAPAAASLLGREGGHLVSFIIFFSYLSNSEEFRDLVQNRAPARVVLAQARPRSEDGQEPGEEEEGGRSWCCSRQAGGTAHPNICSRSGRRGTEQPPWACWKTSPGNKFAFI